MATSFLVAWQHMQGEVGDTEGPLAQPVQAAGARQDKLQKAITRQRERVRFQHLDVDLRALPADDVRRCAWVNLDRFSTTWVSAWPDRDACLSNAEFGEVVTLYFGLPSPACEALRGQRIGNTRNVLDAHGLRLTTSSLPGDGWRVQHDALKWRLTEDIRTMQVHATTEVYGLFAPLIPQEGRLHLDGAPRR